jgi:hypothetical protein
VKTYVHIHESVEKMVEFCDQGVKAGRRATTIENLRGRSEFIGRSFGTWEEVKKAVADLWQEGLDEVQWMLHELRNVKLPEVACQRRRARWNSDGGDEFDLDRCRSGQDYWRQTRRESTKGPQTICIVTNLTTPAFRDSMEALWRGALAVVLADLLEEQGHRVEVWVASNESGQYQDGSNGFRAVQIKRVDQPVDIATLTNTVSGWFYRTVFFQDFESETASRADRPGYGHCRNLDLSNEHVQSLIGNATPLIVDGIWTKEACIRKATEIIESLNN